MGSANAIESCFQKTLAILNRGNTAVDASDAYFKTVHRWLPFISKKRIDLGATLHNGGPDLAMLFLAMKLVVSPFGSDDTQETYAEAKGFLVILQEAGYLSFCCLQAMILVALYEYGHAVYPAAWFTIGACSRYADLLGLNAGGESAGTLPKVVCSLKS